MAGTHITIEVDDRELRAGIGKMLSRIANPKPALEEIGEVLVQSTKKRFGSETDPQGKRWAPNSPATKARKKGTKILTEEGHLGDLITWQLAGDRAVAVGSNLIYAAIHQFGGEGKHAERTATLYFRQNQRTGEVGRRFVKRGRSNFAQDVTIGAHTTKIPARPFLGLSDEDGKRVVEILRDYLDRAV